MIVKVAAVYFFGSVPKEVTDASGMDSDIEEIFAGLKMSAAVNPAALAGALATIAPPAISEAVNEAARYLRTLRNIRGSLTFVLSQDLVSFLLAFAIDVVSVVILSYALYFRRHRDRDMAIAISSINITLFALTGALASYTLSLGVGFALFAVISVIRLRSSTAGWIEMSYLLVGLAIGLIVGLTGFGTQEKALYTAFLLVVMTIIDNKLSWNRRVFASLFKSPGKFFSLMRTKDVVRNVALTLDGTNVEAEPLRARVEELLGRSVDSVVVKSITSNPAQTKLQVSYRDQVSK